MRSGFVMGRRRGRVLMSVCGLLVAALLTAITPLSSDQPATAAPGQPAVVIVGDSLTAGNKSYIGPTAWVTVLSRNRYDASRWFNTAIGIRAARDPHLALIRWHELALLRPDWFLDHVHQNVAGVKGFTQLYIDRISALLADPLGPRPLGAGLAAAVRLGPV